MRRRASQRGLTLLETLVTLVIVAMVATLMSEGLYQLGLVERRLGSGQMQAQLQRLRVLWVQQALEGLQAGAQETPEFFRGSSRQLQGVSSLLPQSELRGPLPMRLALVYRQELGRTELVLDFGVPDGMPSKAVLTQWAGKAGRLSYLGPQGQWLSDWPPMGANAPLLPRAIAVHGEGDELVVVGTPAATPQAMGKRVDMEKLP